MSSVPNLYTSSFDVSIVLDHLYVVSVAVNSIKRPHSRLAMDANFLTTAMQSIHNFLAFELNNFVTAIIYKQ